MDNTENKIRSQTSIRLSTVATTTRQTPKTDFGTVMRDGLVRAGNVAIDGLRIAAPFVPGGAIVSAALAGANLVQNAGGASYGVSEGGLGGSGGAGGARGGAYGSSTSGLSGFNGGPTTEGSAAIGNYSGNSLSIPGRRPGLETNLSQNSSNFATGGSSTANSSDAFNQMMSATRQMAEFQASFNLQYLQLQEKIQIDTRQFNLVSNIMKTKHDAAKNALNNVR